MRQILPVLAALALAGCAATAQLADPREIAVEADVAPAGAVLSPNMKGLVSQTGPSYVTVIVHEGKPPGGWMTVMRLMVLLGSGELLASIVFHEPSPNFMMLMPASPVPTHSWSPNTPSAVTLLLARPFVTVWIVLQL